MERQVNLRNSILYSHHQHHTTNMFPQQIMSCPDLDMADSFFSDENNTPVSRGPNMNQLLAENTDGYLVNYDIYGRMILDSPRDELQGLMTQKPETFIERNLVAGSCDAIEEEEELTEMSADKENLEEESYEFVGRRRAQSDCFGSLPQSSQPRFTSRRAPLKDITPMPTKKVKTVNSLHVKLPLSPIMETPITNVNSKPQLFTIGMR